MKHLLYFYGDDCPHCKKVDVVAAKLEFEDGIKLDRIEVWHNKDNEKQMVRLDTEPCGGVPFLINLDTGKTICGETTYEEMKKWAEGK